MAMHVGPIGRVRDLRDWSEARPPAPGWVLDQRWLDGWGFLLIAEGRRPRVMDFTTFGFARESRATLLHAPGGIAVESMDEARRLADAAHREADVRDNTRIHLIVDDGAGPELRRVDVTGKPDDLVESIRQGLMQTYGPGCRIRDVTSVFGRDVPAADDAAMETSGPRM